MSDYQSIDFINYAGMHPDVLAIKNEFVGKFQRLTNSAFVFINANKDNVLNVERLLTFYTKLAIQTSDYSIEKVILEKVIEGAILEGKSFIAINYIIRNVRLRFNFFNDIGFYFSDKPEIHTYLQEMNKFSYIIGKIEALFKAGIEITNPIEQITNGAYDANGILISGERGNVLKLLQLEAKCRANVT